MSDITPTPSVEEQFNSKVDAEIESLTNMLTSGMCKNFEQYQNVAGRLHAYRHCHEIFQELVARWKNQ